MNVLIVEDDAVAGLVIERMIRPYLSESDNTTIVKTMAEAEDYLLTQDPDIVTLDLNLPDSRWPITMSRIGEFKKNGRCVVVVLSGVSEPGVDIKQKALSYGADSFLAKGPDFNEPGVLGSIRDAIKSLISQPVRYKLYEPIFKLISEKLGP